MQTTFIKKIRNYSLRALLILALLMLTPFEVQPAYAAGSIVYAAPGGLTSGACGSWANACDLQYALTAAVSGDQVWAAAGTYIPNPSDRTVSFMLKNGVGIYGGFDGTETLLSQRSPAANVTILSGDLNGDDNGFTNNGENSYHVVLSSGITNSTALLDGFTITGGNSNGSGGGLFNDGGSPTLANLIFTGNTAAAGGGMYSYYAGFTNIPVLTNITFSGNSANYGGGLYNSNGGLKLTNAAFSGNSAVRYGGGLYNDTGSPALTNVTFSGNSAEYGGGMSTSYYNSPVLTNVTFSGNSAVYGGGIYNDVGSPTLTNVIVANSLSGGNCYDAYGNIGNSSTYNLIDDGTCSLTDGDQGNMVGAGYPVNLGPLQNNGGYTDTMALLPGSAAIDAGDNSFCPATDQRGVTRPQGAACDIGAYEAEITPQAVIENLKDDIQALENGGVLNHGQATSLAQQLDNALKQLEKGKTANACKKLQDSIDKVDHMTPNPLDTATAVDLIASMEAIQAAVGCP